MEYLNSKNGKVIYDESLNTVHGTYKGFLDENEFKTIAETVVKAIRENKTPTLIVDLTQFEVMKKENQEYIENEWFHKATEAGLKYCAFIVPESTFGKASMEKVNKEAKRSDNIYIQYFNNDQDAEKWILAEQENLSA